MKNSRFARLAVMISLLACALPSAVAAQQHYKIFRLPSLGGTSSAAISVNSLGLVSGFSNQPGDQTQHAVLWIGGFKIDLGTLGGPNSGVAWPNHNDLAVAGIAETAALQPLGEQWSCSDFFPTVTGHVCLGFVWLDGKMYPLPTLGGDNGYAAGANQLGQIVGWAETPVHDPTCNGRNQVLQFLAVVWGPRKGEIHPLPPLAGDPDSAATAINDNGQAVGISGLCDQAVGRLSARHAVLWENGVPINIGDLGGQAWNTPAAINNRGQVVGFSDLPNDDPNNPNFHAFFWSKASGKPPQDLGVLSGDSLSLAYAINDQGVIVGQSIGATSRAFIWENGQLIDMNTLVPAGSPQLLFANDINDQGEIVGQALDATTGVAFAFVAVPAPGGN
jgi:probable HAF family extracellular repeat protein